MNDTPTTPIVTAASVIFDPTQAGKPYTFLYRGDDLRPNDLVVIPNDRSGFGFKVAKCIAVGVPLIPKSERSWEYKYIVQRIIVAGSAG